MDTSKTYIKMCDCEEIQKARPMKYSVLPDLFQVKKYLWSCRNCERNDLGSDYCSFCGEKTVESTSLEIVAGVYGPFTTAIWLPRQDQLQEMVDITEYPAESGVLYLSSSLYKFHSDKWDYTYQFTSMEQLWLAFVMKEKHNKTWDGDKWQK